MIEDPYSIAPTMFVTPPYPSVALNFIGNVTVQKGKYALPLCTVFGLDFFVAPNDFAKLNNPVCVPAWVVPVASGKQGATMRLSKQTEAFSFQYESGRDKEIIKPEITIYGLHMDAVIDGKFTDKVVLTREAIEEQVTSTTKAATTEAKDKEAKEPKQRKAQTKASVVLSEPRYKPFKHMFK